MTLTGSAEENLKVIRSLMERATVYRTLSVPGAIWAGGLSIGAFLLECITGKPGFLWLWGAVLGLTIFANVFFLKREAARDGRLFPSPACWAALRGLLPAFAAAAVVTPLCLIHGDFIDMATVWILLYGVGLLGTQHFAPRSLVILAWLFVLTGFALIWIVATAEWMEKWEISGSIDRCASTFMALTFGLFHLVYALCVHLSLRRERAAQS